MRTRYLWSFAALATALLLMVAPSTTTLTRAQAGPMMQPLDQLQGDDFDKAFLSQMSVHHAMAVVMARPATVQAAHQETKDLAQHIIDAQTKESVEMRAWAKDWYGLDIPDPVAMMDQAQSGGLPGMPMSPGQGMALGPGQGMPGMQTGNSQGMPMGNGQGMQTGNGQGVPGMQPGAGPNMPIGQMNDMSMMASLWKLPPQRLDAVFLALMIPHHQSGIDMASLAPDRAAHQEVKDLAAGIARSQGEEITTMNGWLESWYSL